MDGGIFYFFLRWLFFIFPSGLFFASRLFFSSGIRLNCLGKGLLITSSRGVDSCFIVILFYFFLERWVFLTFTGHLFLCIVKRLVFYEVSRCG